MGLSCILEYHNQKGGFVANRSMHNFFDLLYTLVLFFANHEWVVKIFLIEDWSWVAMMTPITIWYWISLKWIDHHTGWPDTK